MAFLINVLAVALHTAPAASLAHTPPNGGDSEAAATADGAHMNSLSFQPALVPLTFLNLEYERRLGSNFAAYLGGGISPLGFGYTWQVGGRAYSQPSTHSSWFLDVHGGATLVSTLGMGGFDTIGGGISGGRQIALGSRWVLSLGAGLDFIRLRDLSMRQLCSSLPCVALVGAETDHPENIGMSPILRAGLGYRF